MSWPLLGGRGSRARVIEPIVPASDVTLWPNFPLPPQEEVTIPSIIPAPDFIVDPSPFPVIVDVEPEEELMPMGIDEPVNLQRLASEITRKESGNVKVTVAQVAEILGILGRRWRDDGELGVREFAAIRNRAGRRGMRGSG